MEGYEIEHNFFVIPNSRVSFFRGISRERNGLPVIMKRYNFDMSTGPYLQNELNELNVAINKGLAQARVDHLNFCKILEMRVDLNQGEGRFAVYHVLEALGEDMGREVEERKRESRPFSETDIRTLLAQTSSALAFAHSKNIAHCDIKPENILKDRQNNYKLIDFDSYFEGNTLDDQDKAIRGTIPYMSPQARQVATGQGDSYNPFKADVYSLGLTAISLATLELQKSLWPLDDLEAITRAKVQALGYPQDLQDLLISMLAVDERARPSMQQICECSALSKEVQTSPPEVLPNAEESKESAMEGARVLPHAEESKRSVVEGYEIGANIIPLHPFTLCEVNFGKQLVTNREVVIKSYTCENLKAANQPLKEGVIQARFEHPNVCSLLDIRLSGNASQCKVHLVVEKMERNLLKEIELRSQAKRPCSEQDLKLFMRQVGDALAWGKARGLAHRDIKPENILINSQNQYKLCDFGSAWQRLKSTLANSARGTITYMSEKALLSIASEKYKYNPFKEDVYSFGLTILYLAALSPPFRMRSSGYGYESIATEIIARLRLSEGFKQLLQRMVVQEEAQRPDIEEVLSALRA